MIINLIWPVCDYCHKFNEYCINIFKDCTNTCYNTVVNLHGNFRLLLFTWLFRFSQINKKIRKIKIKNWNNKKNIFIKKAWHFLVDSSWFYCILLSMAKRALLHSVLLDWFCYESNDLQKIHDSAKWSAFRFLYSCDFTI